MGFKLDFSFIIAALVLLQLYVLGMNTDKKKKTIITKVDKNEVAIQQQAQIQTTSQQEGLELELELTVHRANGEEKVYTKSNVA